MTELKTASKAQLAAWRALSQKKSRAERSEFLVEGVRIVAEAIASDWNVKAILVTPTSAEDPNTQPLLRETLRRGIPLYGIRASDFAKLSDTVTTQGIIAVVQERRLGSGVAEAVRAADIVVALDAVSDPGNVGTIIRTCDWFGVGAVMLGKGCVELYNPKVLRTTMGSIFHLPVFEDVELLSTLKLMKERGYHVWVSVTQKGRDVRKVSPPKKVVLVVGSEAQGVSEKIVDLADERVTIPRFGGAESLNVAIACGILLASLSLTDRSRVP